MEEPEQRTQRTFRLMILSSFIVPIVVSIGMYTAVYLYASRELRHVKDNIRASGYPVTLEELDHYYDPGPGSAEAGYAIVAAFQKLNGKPVGKRDPLLLSGPYPEPGDAFDDEAIAATRAFVEQNRNLIDEITALIDSNNVIRFPVDFKTIPKHNPFYYEQIRSCIKLLSMDALLAVIDGVNERAVIRICTAYTLAESLRTEPLLLSQLVRGACLKIICDSLELILNHSTFVDGQLLRIQQTLDEIHLNGSIAYGLIGERCALLPVVEDQPPGSIDSLSDFYFTIPTYRRLESITFANSCATWIAIGKLPAFERAAAMDRFQQDLDKRPEFSNQMTKILSPAVARSFRAETHYLTRLSATSTAIAVIRFKRDRDRLPQNLGELVPNYIAAIATDQYDGHSLRYTQRDKGFVVYGLGYDGDDDGGIPPSKDESLLTAGDVVFRILGQ